MYSRKAVVDLALSWIGKNEKDGSHKEIIDVYNRYGGKLPRGIKMEYSWSWCAVFWSALAIKLGYTEIMPIEMSCGYLIEEANKMGCWVEKDCYVPKPGDAVLYSWKDVGGGDNILWPDHIGCVTYVNEESGYFIVTEGNYSDSVKQRTVLINGQYIRGFITPKYDEDMEVELEVPVRRRDLPLETVAREVIAGVWDNDPQRTSLLSAYGYDRSAVQKKVNEILNGDAQVPKNEESTNSKQPIQAAPRPVVYARYSDRALSGVYETLVNLYLRIDAGTNKKALCLMPKGSKVCNYGYYNQSSGIRWPMVEFIMDGVLYTGFCCGSEKYLKKVK